MYKNILITGGCGFIGSHFVNYMVKKYNDTNFINLDKLDYCGIIKNIEPTVQKSNNYYFIKGDINDNKLVTEILKKYHIKAVIHFAAQSHVDNSFVDPLCFTMNNVVGTHQLLDCVHKYGKIEKFIHVSTDEVYGEVANKYDSCNEEAPMLPTTPYSGSKAAAECIVRVYQKSFKLPIIITRGNNVYGPKQFPEKLIPRFITLLNDGKKCTVHGQGESIRNFMYVDDVVKAFEILLLKGQIGEIYNIGTNDEYSVMDITKKLIELIKKTDNHNKHLKFVKDRAFNDFRYAVTSNKLRALGWSEDHLDFDIGLKKTIEWYNNNPNHFIVSKENLTN